MTMIQNHSTTAAGLAVQIATIPVRVAPLTLAMLGQVRLP